jgi:hypothetical protein
MSKDDNAGSKKAARMALAKKIGIGVLVFLVLFGAFGYFILPGILLSQAEKIASEKLHRRLTIQKIEVNPYTFSVTVNGLKLMEADGSTVFVSFDQLRVDASAHSLYRLAPVVQAVQLVKPYVHLVLLSPNHYNFDDLVQLLSTGKPSEPSAEPARFSVHNIQVSDGEVVFDDRPHNIVHRIGSVKLGIPFISSLPSQVKVFVEPALSAKVDGTQLDLKGKALPFVAHPEAQLNLDLDGVDLPHYLDYLPFKPRFKMPTGTLDVHLAANFSEDDKKPSSLVLKGELTLKTLALNDLKDQPVVRLPELKVGIDPTDVLTGQYHVSKVAFTNPEFNLETGSDGRLNLQRMAADGTAMAATAPASVSAAQPAKPSKPSKPSASSTTQSKLLLDELSIQGGHITYRDSQSEVPLNASVDKFNLAVRHNAVELGSFAVTLGEVISDSASILVQRGKKGRDDKATTSSRDTARSAPAPVTSSSKPSGQPEAVPAFTLGNLSIQGWTARVEDYTLRHPVITTVSPVSLTVQDISTLAGHEGKLDLSLGVNKMGRIAIKGPFSLEPQHAVLSLDVKNLDVLPLQPYFTRQINLLISKARFSTRGTLQLEMAKAGLKGGYKGNLSLDDVATVDRINADDFLRWKSLFVGGINLRLAPFALSIDQIALNDFFARVIVEPDGQINLQNILRSGTESPPPASSPGGETNAQPPSAAAPPAPAATPPTEKPPPIKIAKVTLQGGAVRFTDNFVKPNYTADLDELGGVVTGLSSDVSSAASVDLRGKVNEAPLSITGQINPLKGNLFMDLKGEVHGMELSPFSPYSGKYVGYGIEKGKLSFDAHYHVEDHVLKAENHIILDQLTFGEKVDSPDATHLPVMLAVALLRDRNGVIDINLPIGGSLNDPQFSVGGIIVKVIVNLITKAVTAPFALIGSLFGGGETLSWIDFDPGRHAIPASGEEKLKSLAKALLDRPGLKLEITGRSDREADAEGMRRASLESKVRAVKVKSMVSRGESPDLEHVVITPEEYPQLLTRVYKNEKFPKPRNMIGLEKSLPMPEMEKLILANTTVSDEDLANLANQRAQDVKSWLVDKGQVPADRLFIVGAASGKGGKAAEKASPSRVDFSLK